MNEIRPARLNEFVNTKRENDVMYISDVVYKTMMLMCDYVAAAVCVKTYDDDWTRSLGETHALNLTRGLLT